jgi:hypothetical protein
MPVMAHEPLPAFWPERLALRALALALWSPTAPLGEAEDPSSPVVRNRGAAPWLTPASVPSTAFRLSGT